MEAAYRGDAKAMRVIAVAGFYDPIHDGHRSNFRAVRLLGDKLVAIIQPDEQCIKKKSFCYMKLADRIKALQAEPDVDEVVVAIDTDGTVTRTLRVIRPQVFAKGGDRSPGQHPIPQSEIDACNEIGCEIVYNVGEPKRPEWSSTLIGRRALGLEEGKES